MVIHGAVLRQPSSLVSHAHSAASTVGRAISRFARPSAFSLPAGRAAASARAGRNLTAFRSHYAILLWFSLLAALFPSHRASMLFLMAASKIALSYALLLRIFPNSALLRRVLDRRLVASVFVAVVIVELALAGALGKLFVAFAVAAPIVVAHAVLRIPDDLAAAEDGKATVELIAVSEKKGVDLEAGGGGQKSDRSS